MGFLFPFSSWCLGPPESRWRDTQGAQTRAQLPTTASKTHARLFAPLLARPKTGQKKKGGKWDTRFEGGK